MHMHHIYPLIIVVLYRSLLDFFLKAPSPYVCYTITSLTYLYIVNS